MTQSAWYSPFGVAKSGMESIVCAIPNRGATHREHSARYLNPSMLCKEGYKKERQKESKQESSMFEHLDLFL